MYMYIYIYVYIYVCICICICICIYICICICIYTREISMYVCCDNKNKQKNTRENLNVPLKVNCP